jgi:hypothetical protein
MHGACDPSLDVDALLTPLSLICDSLGTPVSPSALANAESIASSVASQTTVTMTVVDTATVNSVTPTPVGPYTASDSGVVVVTVTQITPPASTATDLVSASNTGSAPGVIVGTNSGGWVYTSTVVSTYIQSDSSGTGSSTQSTAGTAAGLSSGSSTSGVSSSTTRSTSSSSTSESQASSSSSSENSSPFSMQNVAGKDCAGSMLGLSVLLMFVGLWL